MRKRLVKYAGYDPFEENLCELAPLHHGEERNPDIDAIKALGLRRQKYDGTPRGGRNRRLTPWREVGRLLAIEENRVMPYNTIAVYNACRRTHK